MLDLAKSEWCWLALVAVFSSHDSIFRTTVSTAAWTDWEKLPKAISACAHVCTVTSAFMCPTREAEAGKQVCEWLVCIAQAEENEWQQLRVNGITCYTYTVCTCNKQSSLSGCTGVFSREASNTLMHTNRSNSPHPQEHTQNFRCSQAAALLQENKRSSELISSFLVIKSGWIKKWIQDIVLFCAV